jgi:hypothetical protein
LCGSKRRQVFFITGEQLAGRIYLLNGESKLIAMEESAYGPKDTHCVSFGHSLADPISAFRHSADCEAPRFVHCCLQQKFNSRYCCSDAFALAEVGQDASV